MATKIQIRRGAGLPPSTLAQGELAYDTQNQRLYIGTGNVASPFKEIGGIDTLLELGITATAEELNTLSGISVDVNDINTLGVYADKLILLQNVTSDIQTQLNNKIDADHSHGAINVAGELTASATPTPLDYIVITDATNNSKIAKGIQLQSYNSSTNKYLKADGEMYNPDATTSLNLQAQESGSNVNILLRGNNEQGVEETKDTLAISPGQNIDLSVSVGGAIGIATTDDITIPKNGAQSSEIVFQFEVLGSDQNRILKANVDGLIYNSNEVWDRGDFTEVEHQYLEDLIDTGVTPTEFDHLDGVTSPIQTQLGGKVSKTGDSMSGPLTMIRAVSTGATDSTAIEMQYDTLGAGTSSKELKGYRTGKLRYGNEDIATENYVDAAVANLIDSAPGALDTLNELAAALGDDSNYAATTTASLNKRVRVDAGQAFTNTEKEQALSNLGVSATPAELNKLDGATVTTAEINRLSGVTGDIQTQLDTKQTNITGAATTIVSSNLSTQRVVTTDLSGKISTSIVNVQELEYLDGATSNIQNQIDNFTNGKADIDDPTFTGTPAAPTASPVTNNTQIATTQFVNTAISNIGAYTPALLEWELVEKLNLSGTGTASISNGTFATHSFDIDNYDYKFVVDLDTLGEDNSEPYIRINGISAHSYNYVYERVSLDAISNPDTGQSTSFGGHDRNLIGTGLLLGSASSDVGLTNLHLEFTVSQSYGFIPFAVDLYSIFVQGTGSALGIDATAGSPNIWPIVSKFAGNISQSSGLSSVDIIHDITEGSQDRAIVRVYKRPK
jgi:hypothetical protein